MADAIEGGAISAGVIGGEAISRAPALVRSAKVRAVDANSRTATRMAGFGFAVSSGIRRVSSAAPARVVRDTASLVAPSGLARACRVASAASWTTTALGKLAR